MKLITNIALSAFLIAGFLKADEGLFGIINHTCSTAADGSGTAAAGGKPEGVHYKAYYHAKNKSLKEITTRWTDRPIESRNCNGGSLDDESQARIIHWIWKDKPEFLAKLKNGGKTVSTWDGVTKQNITSDVPVENNATKSSSLLSNPSFLKVWIEHTRNSDDILLIPIAWVDPRDNNAYPIYEKKDGKIDLENFDVTEKGAFRRWLKTRNYTVDENPRARRFQNNPYVIAEGDGNNFDSQKLAKTWVKLWLGGTVTVTSFWNNWSKREARVSNELGWQHALEGYCNIVEIWNARVGLNDCWSGWQTDKDTE